MTPLIRLRTLPNVWVKDEGANRLGSWADRTRQAVEPASLLSALRPGAIPEDVLAAIAREVREQLGRAPEVLLHEADALPVADAIDAGLRLLRDEGLLLSLPGAACVESARGRAGDCIVVLNPYSGLLDVGAYRRRFPAVAVPETDKLGGLITPR
jgi:hypothetical protein